MSAAAEIGPDLILMDIDLGRGKMEGTEAAERILREREIPIVFCTSHAEKEMVEKVKNITRYGYVLKNSGEFVLLESISMAFELFEALRELRNSEAFLDNIIDQSPVSSWISDGNGVLIKLNDASRKLFGVSDDSEVVGKYDFHKDDILIEKGLVARVEEVFTEGNPFHFEIDYDYRRVQHVDVPGATRRILECTISPLRNAEGKITNAIFQQIDVTDRLQMEAALRQSEERFKAFMDFFPGAVFIKDRDNKLLYCNEFFACQIGKTPEELVGTDPNEGIPPDVQAKFDEENAEVFREKSLIVSESAVPLDGKKTFWLSYKFPVTIEDRTYLGAVSIDVTEQKQTEEAQQLLLKEMNHRVKNNLSMISSLISLTGAKLGEEVDLSNLEKQVNAIGLVHEQLYQTEEITHIDVKSYIPDLIGLLFSSFSADEAVTEFDIENIRLPTKKAVPLGLIVNEIATNAIKYGFAEDRCLRFAVTLKKESPAAGETHPRCVLSVSNSGPPVPDEVDPANPVTMGLRLITILTEQLQGSLDLQRRPHPVFTIIFPE